MGRLITAACIALLLWLEAGGSAAVLSVPGQYPTIQAGIDAAADGDTVLVADGTYRGDGNRNIDFLGKAILVTSENSASSTILDCEGIPSDTRRGFHFHSSEDSTSVLRGFTIMNGYAHVTVPAPPSGCGGAIVIRTSSSPTVEDCVIQECTAEMYGGGMFVYSESCPQVTNCTFTGNRAIHGSTLSGYGGGLSLYQKSHARIIGCTFSENEANDLGGGIAVNYLSSPLIEDCLIEDNVSTDNGGGICSGGSAWGENCSPEIVGCEIIGNSAATLGGGIGCCGGSPIIRETVIYGNSGMSGGGIHLCRGHPSIEGNDIRGNSASGGGGGIFVSSYTKAAVSGCTVAQNAAAYGGGIYSSSLDSLLVSMCTIVENTATWRGGGIAAQGSPEYRNCTIARNTADQYGGAVEAELGSAPSFTNCILWSDRPDEIHRGPASAPEASYSDIEGGFPGAGNIDHPPIFADPQNGDYSLQPQSPCIDVGDPDSPVPPGGGDRIEMGAYEYRFPAEPPVTIEFTGAPSLVHVGDEFSWEIHITNQTGEEQALSAAIDFIGIDGRWGLPRCMILDPFASYSRTVRFSATRETFPGGETGMHNILGKVGTMEEGLWDAENFILEIVP